MTESLRNGYFHFRLAPKHVRYGVAEPRVGVNYDWQKARTLVEQLEASTYDFWTDAAFAVSSLRQQGRSADIATVEIVWTRYVVAGTTETENLFTAPGRRKVSREELLEPEEAKRVFVVHGRNVRLLGQLTKFLAGLGLSTITWNEAVKATGQTAPYILDIVNAGMNAARAVVVLLTPDEDAGLRAELATDADARAAAGPAGQPRANVLIEAGMAIARNRDATILVQVGEIRDWSDFHGIHVARLDAESGRAELRTLLENAGCIVKPAADWAARGVFVA